MQEATERPDAVPDAWKPNSAVRPASSFPFQPTFETVLPLSEPFQRLVTAVPDGRASRTLHPEIAREPAVTRTDPTNPPFQELPTVNEAEQPLFRAATAPVLDKWEQRPIGDFVKRLRAAAAAGA